TASGLCPYHFTYLERKLTMEEMLYKFIDEEKRKHEEMRAFIFGIKDEWMTSFQAIKNGRNMTMETLLTLPLTHSSSLIWLTQEKNDIEKEDERSQNKRKGNKSDLEINNE
ncbi:hypothetical protein Tco_0905597, partial [Tanacetum coccineum]